MRGIRECIAVYFLHPRKEDVVAYNVRSQMHSEDHKFSMRMLSVLLTLNISDVFDCEGPMFPYFKLDVPIL